MKTLCLATALLCAYCLDAQTTIQGTISDGKGEPMAFVNVYLDEIYDGGATDETGRFSFTTTHVGKAFFIASNLGFETLMQEIDIVDDTVSLILVMRSAATELNEVVIAAGAFEASDEKKATLLKPLDIVQNPVAAGDIYGALQTLPGVSQVGNETGLFVRGGEATETKTIIDGTIVDEPFFSDVPDIPSRGRFDPFMFKGTLFSTGGYSAEYGQAMSSVLVLNTQDMPQSTSTGVGLNLAGANLTKSNLWNDRSAFIGSIGYTNLSPYFALVKQRQDWQTPPNGVGGAVGYRHKTGVAGMFKSYLQFQSGNGALNLENANDANDPITFSFRNNNWYTNHSFRGIVGDKWSIFTGLSGSRDRRDLTIDGSEVEDNSYRLHGKVTIGRELGQSIYLRMGGDVQWREEFGRFEAFAGQWNGIYGAGYLESDVRINQNFGLRLGLRAEHEGLIGRQNIAPRASVAYKTGIKSQLSFAYGWFYQTPEADFQHQADMLDFERATHYILNYQYLSDDYTFRIEAYQKDYDDLVLFDSPSSRNNDGDGHARGVDVFWRDKGTIADLDYWVSYSFIDAERFYRDFPERAMPQFVTRHTLNVVSKYRVSTRFQLGLGYTYASGRPYDNPNTPAFLDELTKPYHNASINASYLTTLFKNFTVVYVAIRNPFGIDQVFDYRYSDDGTRRISVGPTAGRSGFIGVFVLIQ